MQLLCSQLPFFVFVGDVHSLFAMDFGKKDVTGVGIWLREHNFSDKVIEALKGNNSLSCCNTAGYTFVSSHAIVDNDVNGEAFLGLKEKDFVEMVPSVGARRRLIMKKDDLNAKVSSAYSKPRVNV